MCCIGVPKDSVHVKVLSLFCALFDLDFFAPEFLVGFIFVFMCLELFVQLILFTNKCVYYV